MSNNPFAVAERPQSAVASATANTDSQRAVAEVQAAMMIARANPRDPIVSMDRILNSCQRRTLAEAAVYSYSRGGSDISGPSIRLAEAIAQQWGNLSYGIRELDQRGGESTVQAYAWDVETNTRREMVFTVPHERHTKSGTKKLTDPRDIYELVANQGARRLRACILSVIPGDVIEAAVGQCEQTMHASADTSPEGIQKLLSAFEQFGVNKEQIEKRIQRRLDAVTPAQVVGLKKVFVSLRDGMSKPGDWFEDVITEQQSSVIEKAAQAYKAKQGAAAPDQAQGAPTSAAAPTPAPASEKAPTFAQVADKLNKAKNLDALFVAADLIGEVADPVQRKELADQFETLKGKF